MLSLGFRACPARLTRHYNPDHDYSAIGAIVQISAYQTPPQARRRSHGPRIAGKRHYTRAKESRAHRRLVGTTLRAALREKPIPLSHAQKAKSPWGSSPQGLDANGRKRLADHHLEAQVADRRGNQILRLLRPASLGQHLRGAENFRGVALADLQGVLGGLGRRERDRLDLDLDGHLGQFADAGRYQPPEVKLALTVEPQAQRVVLRLLDLGGLVGLRLGADCSGFLRGQQRGLNSLQLL